MKFRFLFLFATVIISANIFGQVPNGGFETWSGGTPEGWYGNNIPTFYTPITQSSTAHSGSSSAKGTVVLWNTTVVGPMLQAGATAQGFAVTQKFAKVSGFFQANLLQGDKFAVNCVMYNGNNAVGTGAVQSTAGASWTEFSANITYIRPELPDRCVIQFLLLGPVSGSDYHVGSYFLVDDVTLSGSVGVNETQSLPASFSLEQNFPNPFNPSTLIKYSVPEQSRVVLKVYNAIGTEVATVVNSLKQAGSHEVTFDASTLISGIYFYTLKAGNDFVQTRKMIVLK